MIPPEADAEFVARMEQVNKCTYAKSPEHPVMDEQPPIKETRTTPISADHPRRIDYEYGRAGTASIFMFCEALSAWRQATARKRRTNRAEEVAALPEGRYADCEKITLVCDNLNTHTSEAFYEAFEPARALVRRIEFRYTPKHGSWLNIAENELNSMTRQCLRHRRLGDIETLRISAWPSTSTSGSAASTGR